jgi:hypothetical protein
MSHQTALLSSFKEYLANTDETKEELTEQLAVRDATLRAFPFGVILQVAYPEIDYANRWAWQQFGPRDGECFDVRRGSRPSEYPVCDDPEPHVHEGTWSCHWLVKTDYDFGFCEWFFSSSVDKDRFLAFAPTINWGENFPIKR